MKYRVTYAAAKRKLTYRPQISHGHTTGTIELLDSQPTFSEQKTVEVEAENETDAIQQATANLPEGCDVSASAYLLPGRKPSA